MRLVFDASRPQPPNNSCLNACLAKGPDNYVNNLVGVLVSFRVGRVAAKGDLKKFYNCIALTEEDSHCQRFLWRDMKKNEPPQIYRVTANNIGIKPSGCVATSALELTCDMFMEKYPVVSEEIRNSSYVDDVGLCADDHAELSKKIKQADELFEYGGFHCKGWIESHLPGEAVEFGGEMKGSELEVSPRQFWE